MGLILDTHILWWYVNGGRLNHKQIDFIENYRSQGNLYVSAISFWEVAMLVLKGRITLQSSVIKWAEKVIEIKGLSTLDASIPILIEANELMNFSEGDPADRIIVATARENEMEIMTFDQKIINYANQGYVRACSNEEIA